MNKINDDENYKKIEEVALLLKYPKGKFLRRYAIAQRINRINRLVDIYANYISTSEVAKIFHIKIQRVRKLALAGKLISDYSHPTTNEKYYLKEDVCRFFEKEKVDHPGRYMPKDKKA